MGRTCCKNGRRKTGQKNIRSKKKTEKEKRKAEKNVDGRSGKSFGASGKNEKTQGKCAKTETSGNNYGGETHETQLLTTLHLTVTWVLGLSK